MPKSDVTGIWFNKAAVELYEDLKKNNVVSQPFNDFVRTAFFEKINESKIKFINMSKEHIEKLTFEQMKRLSVQTKLK